MNRIFGQLNFAETLLQTLVILPYSSAANLFYNLSQKSGTKLNSFGGIFFCPCARIRAFCAQSFLVRLRLVENHTIMSCDSLELHDEPIALGVSYSVANNEHLH